MNENCFDPSRLGRLEQSFPELPYHDGSSVLDFGFQRLLKRRSQMMASFPDLELLDGCKDEGKADRRAVETADSLRSLPDSRADESEPRGGKDGGSGAPVENFLEAVRKSLDSPGEGSTWITFDSFSAPKAIPDQGEFNQLVADLNHRRWKWRVMSFQKLVIAHDNALPSVAAGLDPRNPNYRSEPEAKNRLEQLREMIVSSQLTDATGSVDPEESKSALRSNIGRLRKLKAPERRENRLETLRRVGQLSREGSLPISPSEKMELEAEYNLLSSPERLRRRLAFEQLTLAWLISSSNYDSENGSDEIKSLMKGALNDDFDVVEHPMFASLMIEHGLESDPGFASVLVGMGASRMQSLTMLRRNLSQLRESESRSSQSRVVEESIELPN